MRLTSNKSVTLFNVVNSGDVLHGKLIKIADSDQPHLHNHAYTMTK